MYNKVYMGFDMGISFKVKSIINEFLLRNFGHVIIKKYYEHPIELSTEEVQLYNSVKTDKMTMVDSGAMYATIMASKHVLEQSIAGAFVECGVWRGGNAILAAGVFNIYDSPRDIFLYDTFEGMTAPTKEDTPLTTGEDAHQKFKDYQKEYHNEWCYSPIDDVKNNFKRLNLLDDYVSFIKGDVLKTLEIEDNLPGKISVLRLDTDWYESTKIELEVLYPRLCSGGILIIDDYGYWAGQKQAVDEYFETHGNKPFLQRVNRGVRMAVKP